MYPSWVPVSLEELEAIELKPTELAVELSGAKSSSTGQPAEVYPQAIQMAESAACERYLSDLPASVNVLDVAAGLGFFSNALYESRVFQSFHATWVDRDPEGMNEGVRLVDFGAHVRRVPADLTKTTWSRGLKDGAYDCALMGVVHHFLEPAAYRGVIHTIISQKLKPGATLAIVEVCGGLFAEVSWQKAASTIVETLRASAAKDIAIITAPVRVGPLHETFTYRFVTAAVQARP